MTTWTPATKDAETWTAQRQETRVFDPYVFDLAPVFDTGSAAGIWATSAKQSETWTSA